MKSFYRIFSFFLVFMLLFVVLGLGGFFWFNRASYEKDFLEEQEFHVPSGATLSSVAHRLESMGLVRSSLFIRFLARVGGQQTPIKKGTYRLSSRMNSLEIYRILQEGDKQGLRVALPEGLTLSQVAQRLEEEGVISSAELLMTYAKDPVFLETLGLQGISSVEGYLFPDTYLFSAMSDERFVLKYLVENFFKHLARIVPDYQEWDSVVLHERIILASIVEKEYRVDEEAPLIASVFLNRLAIRMPLGSCATLVYVIREELGRPHPTRIFWSDTRIPSRYNTYQNRGLPPGPIASMGLVALKAAFFPQESPYLFFVVEDPLRGTHTFTEAYADHQEAAQRYLESFVTKGSP